VFRLSLLLHPGPAITPDAIAGAIAPVVRGKLGTSTLAIALAHHEKLAAIAVYESADRYQLHVPAAALEREAAAATAANDSLFDLVRRAARVAKEGKIRDLHPGAPAQTLPDDWLELVAAEVSRITHRAMWAEIGDRFDPARYVLCEHGATTERISERSDCARANAAAARLVGRRELDLRDTFAGLERPAPPLFVVARRGAMLARPEETDDTSHLELVD